MSFVGRHVSIQGKSHIAKGLPCQDSSNHYIGDNYAIAAVADGHGGNKYIRSNMGSSFAVDSAINVIKTYFDKSNEFDEKIIADPDRILPMIANSIIANWHASIEEYEQSNPLTDSEIDFIQNKNVTINEWEQKYGTTLIVTVLTDKYTFGLQIGDGDYVQISNSGEAFSPMPEDENCVGNITTSLCNSKASSYFRFCLTEPCVASIVSTDGFTTTFISEESFLRQCYKIVQLLNGDMNSAWETIKKDLIQRSKSNNQDDVSISVIIDKNKLSQMVASAIANTHKKKNNKKFHKRERNARKKQKRKK